ncbi:MAG: ATP-NAD kinase [Bacteroidetes bacterium]|nr:ATP-NAD kinase [Bacteroidota bacterium]
MRFGITGNAGKDSLWKALTDVIRILDQSGYAYVLHRDMAEMLATHGMAPSEETVAASNSAFIAAADIILSFGGDGTLLNTVAAFGQASKPILGVNHGRLGFLANVEGSELSSRLDLLRDGTFIVEERLVLEATCTSGSTLPVRFALNEFTVQRSGAAGLLGIRVLVDGREMNTYSSDGLIISTPTGSTAYSLALGGPIMAPGCGSVLITPIAPHTLTVRPVVLPETAEIQIEVVDMDRPYIITADGVSYNGSDFPGPIRIARAEHRVRLVRFKDQDYFSTLRSKLMWGARKQH